MMKTMRWHFFPIFIFLMLLIFIQACSGIIKPSLQPDQPIYVPPPPQKSVPPQSTSIARMDATQTVVCTNSLRFVADITIPDGSQVKPGELIEKIWEVENDGSCNWDDGYRLKWIGGTELGTQSEWALYPARSGSRAQISVHFTAPETPSTYHSAWQAYDPQGTPFGDPIYVEFVVAAP